MANYKICRKGVNNLGQ